MKSSSICLEVDFERLQEDSMKKHKRVFVSSRLSSVSND